MENARGGLALRAISFLLLGRQLPAANLVQQIFDPLVAFLSAGCADQHFLDIDVVYREADAHRLFGFFLQFRPVIDQLQHRHVLCGILEIG